MIGEYDLSLNNDEDYHRNPNLTLSSSLKHVNYCCGSCGYELNLNSCNRNSVIGLEYEKSIKRGIISFITIDESRFTKIERGLFRRRTKLLCYNCGNYIGNAYKEKSSSSSCSPRLRRAHTFSWDGMSDNRIYNIKIRALQPSFSEDSDLDAPFTCR
ncbi:hypothetical protein ACFE04_012727 [Oxalis oulophora]